MTRTGSSVTQLAVLLALETIDDIVVRGFACPPDRLILSAAADPSIESLVVVAPYRSRAGNLRRRLSVGRRDSKPLDVVLETVEPLRLAWRDPTSPERLASSYRKYDDAVGKALSRLGLHEPVTIDFNPLHAGFGPCDWAGSYIYYARDDWRAHPTYHRWWPALDEAVKGLRARSRAVAAVSQVLLDRLAPTGPSIVLPNGIDESEWTSPDRPPRWFTDLPAPRFLYVGTLDDRLDTVALEDLARGYPSASVVLVGPVMEGSPVASLEAPNIHVFGHQDRRTVVSVTAHADVCLLVHRRTPLTEAMSPLKLYEYLAGGCPVVATDLEPVRGISGRVTLFEDPDDVVDAARAALGAGRASESERAEFIADNSWAGRHRQLLDFAFSGAT